MAFANVALIAASSAVVFNMMQNWFVNTNEVARGERQKRLLVSLHSTYSFALPYYFT